MKKLITMMLAICLALSLALSLAPMAFATETVTETTAPAETEATETTAPTREEDQCGEDLRWKFEDGTLTVSGTGEMDDYEEDAPWAEYKKEITELKKVYEGKIDLFLGLEFDMYSGVDLAGYDYLLGACHYFVYGHEPCVGITLATTERTELAVKQTDVRGLDVYVAVVVDHLSTRLALALYGQLTQKPQRCFSP